MLIWGGYLRLCCEDTLFLFAGLFDAICVSFFMREGRFFFGKY